VSTASVIIFVLTRKNKEFSQDWLNLRHLSVVCSNAYTLSQQQVLEMRDVEKGKQTLMQINDSVLTKAGLDVHRYNDGRSKRERSLTSVGEMCEHEMEMTHVTVQLGCCTILHQQKSED
jgi:hypothetical protein